MNSETENKVELLKEEVECLARSAEEHRTQIEELQTVVNNQAKLFNEAVSNLMREFAGFNDAFQKKIEDSDLLILAAHASAPSESEIERQIAYDRGRNPYNDDHKPKHRSRLEIVADYKVEYAKTVLKKLKEGL